MAEEVFEEPKEELEELTEELMSTATDEYLGYMAVTTRDKMMEMVRELKKLNYILHMVNTEARKRGLLEEKEDETG